MFVDSPGMLDTDLPIGDIQILENALGDEPLAFEFQTSQYVFLPIIIQENQDVEYLQDFRWPFTKESEAVSHKGSLTVHKEVIAPWQFRDINGDFNAKVRQTFTGSVIVRKKNLTRVQIRRKPWSGNHVL